MSYRNFNRHKCFDKEMFHYYSRVKSDIIDYLDWEEIRAKRLVNCLYGMWDGFLYDGLVDMAKEAGIPKFLVYRLERVIKFVEEYMANGGEITENEAHAINLG